MDSQNKKDKNNVTSWEARRTMSAQWSFGITRMESIYKSRDLVGCLIDGISALWMIPLSMIEL